MSSYVGRKAQDADYGMGEHSFDADSLGLIDDKELTQRLLKTFGAPNYQPPRLPAVAMELMSLARNPDVEFDAIERLLEQDAMLTGEILAIARSSAYAGRGEVAGIRQALVRLGLKKLSEVVMAAAMNMRVFRSKAYQDWMERLRKHSLSTAHICRFVSRYTALDEEQAFLCGLLHDVGIAGIFLVLGDTKGKNELDLNVLWPAIHAAHTQAGAEMVKRWKLPPEMAMVVGAHHHVLIDGHDHPMAATVCIAEALSLEFDRGLMPSDDKEELPEDGDVVVVDHECDLGQISGMTGKLDTGAIDRTNPNILERAKHAIGINDALMALIRDDAMAWLQAEDEAAAADKSR